jgi:hypothetical protein
VRTGIISSAGAVVAVAAVLAAVPARALAQPQDAAQPQAAQPQEVVQSKPPDVAPSREVAQARSKEAQERRRNIRYMEGVLMQAVRVGAELVGKELEQYEPTGVTVLLGSPRARGFLVDGHGVFFDVEVPDMNQSVIWSVMVTQRDRQMGNALESLTTALRAMPEGAPMQQAQKALQMLNSTVNVTKDSPASPLAPGQVAAQSIPPDPRKLYQDAVISAVVDAMLGYSVQMSLGSDEWLTVAARGTDAPLGPQQGMQESTTITVRVKGADLAIYHSDPTRRAEIREKVRADAKVF